ncbi:DedA family protein [Sphingobacterium griseoflavum]|uniref:Alkaline phosphatase n=1 Tax=Sphingobacterium griseoflavum TaxID=1474952 RepID=A0ABQ3HZU9_9SPHI|nr:VTT domain-containing protein [Sphingobacterium griseoflavum]GHE44444.1 alkaline phosphatase [Sphingobacterium griseoflavum]
MDAILPFLHNLTDPDWLVAHGGLYLLLFIIFAETGILVGFFLPGDPILFIAGIIIANMKIDPTQQLPTLLYWITLICVAAIIGNFVGYWSGKYFGHRLLKMKDNFIFKKQYIYKAQEFYERQGGAAIILARFLPIVRTFAPIVAGIVGMNFRKFAMYNIIGAILWVVSLVTLGYLLGENAWVQQNLEYVILGIVLLATAPVIIKALLGKRQPIKSSIAKEKAY